ncbi:YHS domain-containing (seleno)protein [Bosea sp. TND4EK4]|uniref:YHS domain-containing (seleno)protein n=1 Tax=Bosea sp. TND4EK4 TaxID=1907408 RepID=UPI0009544718|nr:YHS domain-containing (seleno)protein [Bosea sp. TND4EK4]SIQ35244.1 hypothetical protein SAMN05880592_102490 [Bosea sp. TND4EK4]
MKAVPRQRWISLGAGIMSLGALLHPALANTPGAGQAPTLTSSAHGQNSRLPAGLPDLPSFGEAMQRSLWLGLALNGFDPVTYRLGKPVAGTAAHELVVDGIVWRFASAANLTAFREAPEIYAPAFGGFDPTGVAAGVAVDTDPMQFAIVETRLFLFHSAANRDRFLRDKAMLATAQGLWPTVERTVAR